MTAIKEFLEKDREVADCVIARLRAFTPEVLSAFDDIVAIFERLSDAISQGATDDDDLRIINENGTALGAEGGDDLRILLDAPPPSDSARAAQISQVRTAGHRVSSRRVRGVMLGLLWRSYLRATTDLLRLRGSSTGGYLRLQIEAAGLAAIMGRRPEVASIWQRTGLDVDGRQFFRKHQADIMAFADRHRLRTEYETASSGALHIRLASVARGFESKIVEAGERRVHKITVQYLEDTPDEPWMLILDALNLLRAQYKLMAGIRDGFPEVTDLALTRSGLPEFKLKLEQLFARFRESFPDKVREWVESESEAP